MNRFLLILISALLCIACSGDDNGMIHEVQKYSFQLQLVSISAGNSNKPAIKGKNMEWQEYYLLYPDSTFLRSRTRGTSSIIENGTFAREDHNGKQFLVLTYPEDSRLQGDCTSKVKEYLYMATNGNYLNTWGACDGPVLEYKVIEH